MEECPIYDDLWYEIMFQATGLPLGAWDLAVNIYHLAKSSKALYIMWKTNARIRAEFKKRLLYALRRNSIKACCRRIGCKGTLATQTMMTFLSNDCKRHPPIATNFKPREYSEEKKDMIITNEFDVEFYGGTIYHKITERSIGEVMVFDADSNSFIQTNSYYKTLVHNYHNPSLNTCDICKLAWCLRELQTGRTKVIEPPEAKRRHAPQSEHGRRKQLKERARTLLHS